MKTTTLFEKGNTYDLTYQKSKKRELGKVYISIDGECYKVISKVQTNEVTVTDEMSENVKPLNRQSILEKSSN